MSKQVASKGKQNVGNILSLFGGQGSRRGKRASEFLIPAMFIRFTKDGLQIGTNPQQDIPQVHPEVAKVRRSTAKTSHRGRQPGAYVATEKSTSDLKLTDSMQLIHDTLASRKRGLTAMQLADRLDMPMGTVGWALTRMQQRGAVAHAKKDRKKKAR